MDKCDISVIPNDLFDHFPVTAQVLLHSSSEEDPPGPGDPDVRVHPEALLQPHQRAHHYPAQHGGDSQQQQHLLHRGHTDRAATGQ